MTVVYALVRHADFFKESFHPRLTTANLRSKLDSVFSRMDSFVLFQTTTLEFFLFTTRVTAKSEVRKNYGFGELIRGMSQQKVAYLESYVR